eukprot:TRINITY_DN24819_c0_g1_i1.p1 TRINITY_DN24819_c0_g1~~TRINITY_DN24819_c0_g1_i1.p1  ORF type:complete len:413 (+),score=100.25 TRINITY_DN24819_c0_g1_i1:229-1467(+)
MMMESGFGGGGAQVMSFGDPAPPQVGDPKAAAANALQQKMQKQRQIALERQRQMARTRVSGGVLQANHQLPTAPVAGAASPQRGVGRLFGVDVDIAGVNIAVEKAPPAVLGGGKSLRSAGASLLGQAGGGPGAVNADVTEAGQRGKLRQIDEEAISAFGMGNETPGGLNPGGKVLQATPRRVSSRGFGDGVEEINIDGAPVMELDTSDAFTRQASREKKRSPSGAGGGRFDARGGAISPMSVMEEAGRTGDDHWGGGMRQQRGQDRTNTLVSSDVGRFDPTDGDEQRPSSRVPRGGRRAPGSLEARPGGVSPVAGQSPAKKSGWDLDIAPQPLPQVADAKKNGGGWGWNPFGGRRNQADNADGGEATTVTAVTEIQEFGRDTSADGPRPARKRAPAARAHEGGSEVMPFSMD